MGKLWRIQDEKIDVENEKEPDVNKKKNRNVYFFPLLMLFFYIYPQGDQQAKKSFNIS